MNELLAAIQNRVSSSLLEAPGPDAEQVKELIKAAIRAPDHADLKPWRFVVVEGGARNRLGELMADAASEIAEKSPHELEKIKRKALRAPLIIVVAAYIQDHPKVPKIEQLLSAGAAATNILHAASAMGFGAMWRTGGPTYSDIVRAGLGLSGKEEIVGFIYLGTPRVALKPVPERNPSDYLTYL